MASAYGNFGLMRFFSAHIPHVDAFQKGSICQMEYDVNMCEDLLIPAMVSTCLGWKQCIEEGKGGVSQLSQLRIAGEVLADALNGFTAEITWKTYVRAHD